MHKAMTEMHDELKKADMFLEVRDARIPVTSFNRQLLDILKEKSPKLKRVVIFNKMDLCNETKTLAHIKRI